MLSLLAVTLWVIGTPTVIGETTTPVLEHEWPSGFKMNIRLQLLEKVTGGWSMTLRFTKPAPGLMIWRAKIVSVSNDSKVYELRNMWWNGDLQKCYILKMDFRAGKGEPEKPAPEAVVKFRRNIKATSALNVSACLPTTKQPQTTIPNLSTPSSTPHTTITPPLTTKTTMQTITGNQFTVDPLVDDQTTTAIIVDEWNSGFKMIFRFTIQQPVYKGWKIRIKFSKPALGLQLWRAEKVSVSSDKKTYFIKNMSYNKVLAKCTVLEIRFLAYKQTVDDAAPKAEITFYRNGPNVFTNDGKTCTTTTTAPKTNPFTRTTPNPSTTSAPPTTTTPPTTKAANTISRPTTQTLSKQPITSTPTLFPSPYDYSKVLHASILFYEAQRSGKLPPSNRISWRGDSALSDRGNNGEDLTGGWYDAGDFVKFGFPMASSLTVLAWGLVEFRDAYKAAGELDYVLDSLKWATDYFIKAHTAKFEFYGQVGDGHLDHAYWGRPEDMTMKRPAFKVTKDKPGSDLAAETAAALAAASMCFAQTNQIYANTLIRHAEELYEFADKYRGKYSDSITNAASFYKSYSGFNDELVWGAAWLYKATMKQTYLTIAEQYYTQYDMKSKAWAFSWDDKKAGVQLLLAGITGKANYEQDVQTYLDSWLPGGDVSYTPKGLAWRAQWGPNRYSANTAFLALVAAKLGLKPQSYRNFATKQIHYMLGDTGRSFVVGFGIKPPLRPHHASSSCPSKPATCTWNDFKKPGPNPKVLTGALVGGPDISDNYYDKRSDYIQNEVTTDYNAGFQSAVAGLKDMEIKHQQLYTKTTWSV